jgi:methylenetetrahydrofolate reductase (NADPH)
MSVEESDMPRLESALESNRFVVTSELNPPKGVDLGPLLEKAKGLSSAVDAFNLTDSHTAKMSMAPLGAARALVEAGLDPILQMTGRDRNRIAIQGDLLAAAALGVSNVLCMSGDDPRAGDHPDAKGVFDLEAIGILRAVAGLIRGEDLGGSRLTSLPRLFPGAVANPGADDLDHEKRRMEQNLEAGARFFQTQPIFDPPSFEKFSAATRNLGTHVIAGVMLLKSAKMARNVGSVSGISVPDSIVRELEEASDARSRSIEITGRIVKELAPLSRGVHVMALGWEDAIPAVLERAGVDRAPQSP